MTHAKQQTFERPLLMTGAMVRAVMRDVDPKGQTRRCMNPQPVPRNGWDWSWPIKGKNATPETYVYWRNDSSPTSATTHFHCPYGKPGDRLWVRETWTLGESDGETGADIYYRADDSCLFCKSTPEQAEDHAWKFSRLEQVGNRAENWQPSIFMPRWASRLTLQVINVRVERLQDISEADAIAEGVTVTSAHIKTAQLFAECRPELPRIAPAQQAFSELWESINGKGSWDLNPWVWAISFRRIEGGKGEVKANE